MHASLVVHLLRRGFQLARHGNAADDPWQPAIPQFTSPLVLPILVLTGVLFLVAMITADYSTRFVIGNLAIVENTIQTDMRFLDEENAGQLILDEYDEESTINSDGDKTFKRRAVPVTHAIITSSIRNSMSYMRKNGGIASLFQGFGAYILWSIPIIVSDSLYASVMRRDLTDTGMVAWICLNVLILSPLHCSWTHATIRAPPKQHSVNSHMPRRSVGDRESVLTRYFPGFWSRHLILPNLRLLSTIVLAFVLMQSVRKSLNEALAGSHHTIFTLLVVCTGLAFLLGMILPSYIALIRVEASLLPKRYDAAVPFERTFGGRLDFSKPQPLLTYITRHFSTVGARKTIDMHMYVRVVKIHIKTLVFMGLIASFFWVLTMLELLAIAGSEGMTWAEQIGLMPW